MYIERFDGNEWTSTDRNLSFDLTERILICRWANI